MADKVKLGIIGYGHIGSQHGRAIRDGKCPQVDLTAVCDIDPARLELAKKTNGEGIQTFTDASELIHSGACEAVIIAVPHYLHPSMAIEAMETGLHVIVEKPAGVYTKQVEEMNAVAAKHPELVYCMDFNQRTNPLYKKVKDLIDSGDLGEMTRVIWIVTDWYRSQSYYDQGGWRATWDGEGGGVLLNQNPHNLDLWQWMCGIPKRVKSQVYYGKHRNIEVEDDLYALVEYENGATGCYITTVGDAPGTNRLEIDGTNGKIVVENNELTFYRLRIPEPEFNATYKGGLGKPEVWECKIDIYPNRDSDSSRLLKGAGIKPNTRFTTSDRYAAHEMVAAGLGFTVINETLAIKRDDIKILPLDPPQNLSIGLACLPNPTLSTRRFIGFMQESMRASEIR